MNLIRAAILFLSIVATSWSVFGQERKNDRAELFLVAYQQLPHAVSFLFDSPSFISQLTPEEKAQLEGVFGVTEKIKMAPLYRNMTGAGAGFLTDMQVPELEFISDPKAFKLTPDEPERLAKTTEKMSDPISINEVFLNSKNMDPSYMDVLQILIHEVGHKLGARKNQQAVDSLGAKMIQFLMPYYQSAIVSTSRDPESKAKIEILSLPIELIGMSTGMPETVRILINERGLVGYHVLDLRSASGQLKRFTRGDIGNFDEQIVVRMTNLKGIELNSFRAALKFNLEVKSRVVFEDPRVDFIGSGATFGGLQVMRTQNNLIDILQPSFANIEANIDINRPSDSYGKTAQYYIPDFSGRDYRDDSLNFKVSQVTKDGMNVRMQIASKFPVGAVQLRLQNVNAIYLVSGQISTGADGSQNWSFKIPPELSSVSGELKIRDVVVNKQSKALLPEVLSLDVKKSEALEMSRPAVYFYDGTNWVPYDRSKILALPPGPARMRVTLQDSADLAQLRIRWKSAAKITYGQEQRYVGLYSSMLEETLNDLKLVSDESGIKTYEFLSAGSIARVLPKPVKSILAQDSYRRELYDVVATSNAMESAAIKFTDYDLMFNNEHLIVTREPEIRSCSGLF
jgi:hypothetical protein